MHLNIRTVLGESVTRTSVETHCPLFWQGFESQALVPLQTPYLLSPHLSSKVAGSPSWQGVFKSKYSQEPGFKHGPDLRQLHENLLSIETVAFPSISKQEIFEVAPETRGSLFSRHRLMMQI